MGGNPVGPWPQIGGSWGRKQQQEKLPVRFLHFARVTWSNQSRSWWILHVLLPRSSENPTFWFFLLANICCSHFPSLLLFFYFFLFLLSLQLFFQSGRLGRLASQPESKVIGCQYFFSDFSSLRRRTQVNNATARVQTKKPAALPNGKSAPFRPEFRKLLFSPYKKHCLFFTKLLRNGYYRMSMWLVSLPLLTCNLKKKRIIL